jgi:hypothetical protein
LKRNNSQLNQEEGEVDVEMDREVLDIYKTMRKITTTIPPW